jgi:hypothetical protein
MSTNSKQNKVTRQARISQVILGIQKYFMNQPAIVLGDTSFTPTHLVETLQEAQTAATQTSKAKAAWMADVQTERDVLGKLGPLLRYIRSFVIAQYGDTQSSSQKLEDFGYSPRKVTTKTVAVKAQAAATAKATRVARATKGTKQKANIKGTAAPATVVDGTVVKAPAPAASTAPAQVKATS